MQLFRVIVQNSDASEQWELPYSYFYFSEALNKDRDCNFRFEAETIADIADQFNITIEYIFSAAYREIKILDTSDNVLYTGYVDDVTFTRGENDQGNIQIGSKGFFSLLAKRYTNSLRTYSSQDASDIAWDLIDYTQNLDYGDFGITRGADPTSSNHDRTYRYKNIAQAIEKLSNNEIKDGIDFDINNDKQFNVYYPEKGSKRNNIVLEEGFNILTYTIRKKFIGNMANQVLVFGQGQDEDMPVEVRDAADVYKSNFFLLQETLSEKDVIVPATLQAKGDVYLDSYKYPQKLINITTRYDEPDITTFEVGDRLRLVIPKYQIDGFLRLVKRGMGDDGIVQMSFDIL